MSDLVWVVGWLGGCIFLITLLVEFGLQKYEPYNDV